MLDDFVKQGKVRYYGVSVEKVEEGLKAIEFPNVQTVQLIFNCLRQRPAELFFTQAQQKQVGILARVPPVVCLLESCERSQRSPLMITEILTGRRVFRRWGNLFWRGLRNWLAVIDEIRRLIPRELCMSPFALRWILMFDGISCAIPEGKNPEQVAENCRGSDLPPLTAEMMHQIRTIYDQKIRPLVHHRW